MTRQCVECEKTKQLNEENFRISRGYYSRTCRACQNARKRKKYHRKPNKPEKIDPKKALRQRRFEATLARYEKVFEILESVGMSIDAPAEEVDAVLGNYQKKCRRSA